MSDVLGTKHLLNEKFHRCVTIHLWCTKYDDDVFKGGWSRAHVEILAYVAYNNSKFTLRHWIFKVPPIICCVHGGGAGVYNITLHLLTIHLIIDPRLKTNYARGLGLVVTVVKPSTGITALLRRSRPDPTVVAYSVLTVYIFYTLASYLMGSW